MRRLLATQPFLTTAFITAAIDLAVAYGAPIPPEAKAPIISIITMVGAWIVHRTVSSPATVVEAVEKAATRTATILTHDTVGVAGSVSEMGERIVGGVVDGVVGRVGGLVPRLTGKEQ